MALEAPVPRSASGIVEDSDSHTRRVPTTLRSDGTERKERKIRPGFTPLEDVGRFRSPRVAERAAREGSPQLGAGLGGRSLESWANDALKDQGMQQASSPLRGGGGSSRSSTPSSFRAPPAAGFPSLSSLGDALPSSSSRTNVDLAPHQQQQQPPLDPHTSSAPSSPPPRRPWPSRPDTNSIASTPPTRPSTPPLSSPPLHAPHAMVTDSLDNDNKAPPSPASYSKTRRTTKAPSSSSQSHTVQSDWNAAKHCFTAPPPPSRPQGHRRTSSSSAAAGAGTVGSPPGTNSSSTAPPSSFNNNHTTTVPKRRSQHGRSNSSTSSNTSNSNSNKPKPLTSPSQPSKPNPSSPPQSQSHPSTNGSDLISAPAPSPIESPSLIIVKLPPSRIKPTPLAVEEPATTATFNNKPIPTGPRNPTPVVAKRVGGSWGAPSPAPAPPPVGGLSIRGAAAKTSVNNNASSSKPVPPHLASTPTPTLPTPSPAQLPPAPSVPSPPPAPAIVARPPRVKSEGGTWGLQAKAQASLPPSVAKEPPLEVAVHLPPSEAKLAAAGSNGNGGRKNGKNGKDGHRRGGSSISISAAPAPPRVVEPVKVVPAPVKVVEKRVVEEEKAPQELELPVVLLDDDDPATWGVPLSGRSWADDDDSF